MERRQEPSYFAIIPASVRYDKIPQGAKLLYGEISSLCNKEGYCWAGNAYFAELYQTNEKTIRNWISALRDSGHIKVDFRYVSGKKEIESRLIRLTDAEIVKNKDLQPVSNNNDESEEVGKNFATGGEKICHTYGKNLPQVGKISSTGGEKICRDNNTTNIKNTTTTSPPEHNPDSDPLPTVEKVVADTVLLSKDLFGGFEISELKAKFIEIDPRLVFDEPVYQKAANFMTNKNLDYNYALWLRNNCEKMNYRVFKSLYYSLFFKDSIAEEYKASRPPSIDLTPVNQEIACQVCGITHHSDDDECPVCKLPKDPNTGQLQLYRELYSLPPDKRDDYLLEVSKIDNDCGTDFLKRKKQISKLRRDFDLKLTS